MFILGLIVFFAVQRIIFKKYNEQQIDKTQQIEEKKSKKEFESKKMIVSKDLPFVTIVTTGGTIAEKLDPKTGGAVPAVSGKDLIQAVPGLCKIANINVVNFSNIDSSQMTPELWAKLSKKVDEILSDSKIKGVVVTHGTDTMSEGSYFLELTVKSEKPVVFVGAMRDSTDISPDGPANILNAVVQVCSPEAQNWGVTVSLNQYVNGARDVRKTQTSNVQTFNSGERGYLGYINMGKVIKFNERPKKQKFEIPNKLPNVVILSDYAGSNGSFIKYAVDSGVDGIVVEAVGAGNVNDKMYDAIKYALSQNIPVVITTRVYHGKVLPIYADQGGGKILQKEGAILGNDLITAKARILLMLAIPQANGNKEQLKSVFKNS
ncbi:asparaginase [Candidatus Dependentiae bacterium]|nr:asparaginase [Candidatus Dependentiae bacterium]